MNEKAKHTLIDAAALSKKLCKFPLVCELAYATQENFVGRLINGYAADAFDICLIANKAAHALCQIQNFLNKKNLGLLVYDAYRPLRAVHDFANWFKQPANAYEMQRKQIHYPNLDKTDLAVLGYVPDSLSKHNFGNAIDLTLVQLDNLAPLTMGACFDYFDKLSHTTVTAAEIGKTAYENRQTLAAAMEKYGFIPYDKEFWHFNYYLQEIDEPMDLPITNALRGLNVAI